MPNMSLNDYISPFLHVCWYNTKVINNASTLLRIVLIFIIILCDLCFGRLGSMIFWCGYGFIQLFILNASSYEVPGNTWNAFPFSYTVAWFF